MPKLDIVGKKRWFFTFSIIITIIGIVGFIVRGFEYDIQFAGGTSIEVLMSDSKFDTKKAEELVKDKFDKKAIAYKLKTFDHKDKKNQLNILKIQISESEGNLNSKEFNQLIKELQNNKDFNIKKNQNIQTQNIEPAMGRELRNDGFMAVGLSMLLIAAYIALRFKLMSGMAAGVTAIIGLLHDVLIMLSVYAIFRIPINDTFIAAILTIIGYSVHDTIIIYDRIRENMNKLRKMEASELVNISIVQTLARSINTVATVLICVIMLDIFASINNIESIKEFSFPLIIGITSGAYSSICICSQLWVVWKNKQEKNKTLKRTAKKARA